METQWANALPKTVSAERFVRTVLTEVSKTPRLSECSTSTFLGAVTMAAQLGLEFGPLGLAYLVPFKNHGNQECQLIIGYKGYLQLARRSGDVKDIIAKPVHEKDQFRFWDDEDGTHMVHTPADEEDRGPVILYWGRCTYVAGGATLIKVSLAEIEKRRERSASASGRSSPWNTDPEAMRLKTVVRMMVPWLPLATEVASGIASDEQVIRLSGSNLVVEHPEQAIEAGATVTTVGEGDTGEREAEEELSVLLDSLEPADRRNAESYLVATYGNIKEVSDEDLAKAIHDITEWGKGEGTPEATSAPEVAQEPSEGEPGPSAPEAPSGGISDADLARITATVTAMPAAKVDELSGIHGILVEGRLEARRLRLLPVLVEAFKAGDQSVIDLF
jgi:recombination protein RecT